MKKLIFKFFLLIMIFFVGNNAELIAQNYYSKPEAVQNLSDESKHLNSTLEELAENDIPLYKIHKEKIRFIGNLLRGLKTTMSVSEAAEKFLPKEEINVIQPSIGFIDTSFSGLTPNRYIRSEMLFLISY